MPHDPSTTERIGYSVNEICKGLAVSRAAVYRWMASGKIKYVQVGDRLRRIPATEYARLRGETE
jgi:excisionase family DNA binding protein